MADGSSWNPYEVRQSANLQTTGEADLKNLTIVATILLSLSMLTFALDAGGIALNLVMGIGFSPPPGFDQNNMVAFRLGQIGSIVLPFVCQLMTIFGSVAMIARKQLGLAWAGAVSGQGAKRPKSPIAQPLGQVTARPFNRTAADSDPI